ncbi:MAG: biotin--[acetyl-CoA-carboxylase] ligase [Acidobacteriota bacterium]|nr:biotin--[acetyl-CoA-carboxylase] ligase [Acidobacteriota bacterium]
MNITILRFDSLLSTNIEAAHQARRGANEGLCIVARQQTAGRGRHGRVWVSPENAGLYFSIVLRPKMKMSLLPLLTLMSAIAVFDILQKLYGLKPDIKWANDVLVNNKKICGILAETIETKLGLAVIVGIGINLQSENFPPELREIATSIEEEAKQTPNLENLLQDLTNKFSNLYQILQKDGGAAQIRQEWMQRSSYAFGQEVGVVLENETVFGTTRGIEQNGALRVETKNGEVKIVHAGDVTKIRKTV